ncbi:MAG TPA: aminotransferase class V-fold PLP-dependent enzyme [Candidatus Limnocylindrales bacterium]
MPHADSAETARRWATERAIDLWVLFEGDLDAPTLAALSPSLDDVRADGGRLAVVAPSGCEPTSGEMTLADFVVAGPRPPAPFGLFTALEAAGVADVRRLGVVGRSTAALEAGHRAGAGAIVGLARPGELPASRQALLDGQPDLIVEPSGLAGAYRSRWSSDRAHRERVLLNPGPAVVSDRVHRAIAGPDLCHREPEYGELFASVRSKLLRVAEVEDDWAVVLLAGSGTAAMEAMTGAAVRAGRQLLVCENGIYGERIATIGRRRGIDVVSVRADHTEPIDPDAVGRALDAHPGVDAVAIIHHETTTGLLNPVNEVAAVADRRGVPVLVDAISSFGAEELRLEGSGIDFVAGTSNKCLHGLPGVAFLLVSPRGQGRAAQVPPSSLYFDVPNYLAAQAKNSVPFTPAIPAVYGLDAALDELLDEGLEHRRERYAERMAYLDQAFERLGLEPVVAQAYRSASVRSLPLPAGLTYEALHDAVKADGFVIYAGLGQAAATNFRVCALGNLEVRALAGFIESLERALEPTSVAATIP